MKVTTSLIVACVMAEELDESNLLQVNFNPGLDKHNCRTREEWPAEKIAWCCEHKELGCPPTSGKTNSTDCATKEVWSKDKTDWCCANERKGCPPLHNCATKEVWPEDKTEWCCANEDKGCPVTDCVCPQDYAPVCAKGKEYSNSCEASCAGAQGVADGPCKPMHDCATKEVWSKDKTDWCCENRGLGCSKPQCGEDTVDKDSIGCPMASCLALPEGCHDVPEKSYTMEVDTGKCCEDAWCLQCPPHYCRTREMWSPEKSAWCCENEELGCPTKYPCPMYDQPRCLDGSTPAIKREYKDENNCDRTDWEECKNCPEVMPPFCKDGQQPEVTGTSTSDDGCDIPIFKCPATPKCPRRQEWKQHGTACQDACKDLASGPGLCTMQTVSDCFCKEGYVKNKKDKCVPKSQKRCRKEACAKGEIFMECGSSCEPTCENPNPAFCTKMCKLNTCQCMSGKVRRARDGKCVRQRQCQRD